MVFSPLDASPCCAGFILLAATQRLARGFGKNERDDATLRRGLHRQKRFARVVVYSRHADIFLRSDGFLVIPGRASSREPGIQMHGILFLDSGFAHSALLNARPGMTS
jgi:hypothetical protein